MTSEEKANLFSDFQRIKWGYKVNVVELTELLDEHAAEQVEFDIYALWARGGVATPAGLKITIAEAENTIREAHIKED